ncbi:hypothetical protein DYB26_011140 [Aphanomyces astaci]|uniref:Myosin motor domain-containing protein n=1 Tax=Aphanomyces astaci TaxID=112090 RepID=A0A3R6X805_APHAT|nr:hypothetical protein DYB26_011140 [Aphanomyces astaci]
MDGYTLVRIVETQPPNLVVRPLYEPAATSSCVVVAAAAVVQLASLPPSSSSVDNLVHLGSSEEAGALHCLKRRFLRHHIYTNVGKLLTLLQQYTQPTHVEMPPHVYQVAAAAFEAALRCKLVKLQLNASGKIDGCAVTSYLLEKSRLTRVEGRERNYHIFYQLCANMEHSTATGEFAFLGQVGATQEDKAAFGVTMAALDALGFTPAEKEGVVAICKGILYLGNVHFHTNELLPQKAYDQVTFPFRLFHWLLQRINATMMKHATSPRSHILLVDIFGFESFDRNGFEQLCINFANEKLQQVLDSKPKGIFTLLDDEVSIPKSSEYSLHSKLVTAHGKASTVFKAGKSTLTFTLVHYAQPVTYDCADLLAKNKDHVADDILEFCQQECMSLLGEMAPPSPPTTRGDATISATFRRQLKELLARLKDTSTHFIRCIKPNHDQVRDVFDGPYVLDQLRQMGILQALALHHDGLHPFQESHELFYHSYRVIAPPTESTTGDTPQVIPMAERCRDLIQHFPHPGGFAVGITSVFSSLEMHQWLRRQRIAVEGAAVTILQGVWRRAVWRLACRHVGQSMALLHDVASLDDATLSQHMQHATDLVKRFPTCYLSRRLLLQCHEGQMHLERHRRQHDLLLRIQQPRHDLGTPYPNKHARQAPIVGCCVEAMEADLALCAKWRLEADPHVIAFTAAYHRLQTERQAVVQVTLMLRSKVIHVATVEKALRSPMISAQVAERARAALQVGQFNLDFFFFV